MGWFNQHLKTMAKMKQILDETPLIDEIPNVQPSYLTHCFFCCICGHLAWKDPRVQRFYMVHHLFLLVGYDTRKRQYLIAYNARASYKRLKILKQPGRKVLISRKTSKLTWLQIDETPRKQLLKWSIDSIGSFASGFDRHGCMLGHDLAICADISI